MSHILLVEDDEQFRRGLRDILVGNGHQVTEASNGNTGCQLAAQREFDLAISDVQMPQIDGIGFLKWVKKACPMPVILMTAFSHLIETKEAFDLGADEFITKPFSNEEFLKMVNGVLGEELSPNSWSLDSHFGRIPIEDFVSGTSLNVGVYVRLSGKKYVRVAHLGDRVPSERVESYKKKGLHHLYVRKDEFAQVVGFNLGLLRTVAQSEAVPPEKKARFLLYTTHIVLEQARISGIDKRAFGQAKEAFELALGVVTESDRILKTLIDLEAHADWLYAHCLAVGLYSAMIGRAMGWNSQTNIFKLALAGLLHDVGFKEIDRKVLDKPRSMQSQGERAIYETHPVRSQEILATLEGLPDDVARVALEHHENQVGGFPRRLANFRIHPFARVVNVADRFCYYSMKSPISPGHDAPTTYQHLLAHEYELDVSILKAFKKCLSL